MQSTTADKTLQYLQNIIRAPKKAKDYIYDKRNYMPLWTMNQIEELDGCLKNSTMHHIDYD